MGEQLLILGARRSLPLGARRASRPPGRLEDPAIAREDGDPPWTAELWPEGRVRPAPKMRRLAQWTVLPSAQRLAAGRGRGANPYTVGSAGFM